MERTLILDAPKFAGKEVTLSGWVDARRDHGKIIFIDLRDRTSTVQVVFVPDKKNPEFQKVADSLRSEYVVEITGTVNERPKGMINEKIPTGKIEILARGVKVLNSAYPLPIDLGANTLDVGLETLLDMRPLTLKHAKVRAIFRVQAEIVKAFHEFFSKNGFTEIQAPKIVAEATEGGSEVFPIEYFESTAYLAQSPQFYKQIMVGIFERVFTIGNVYRAEPHDTARHLNEYTSLDLEMGFIKDHTDLMKVENDWLSYLAGKLKENCAAEFELLSARIPEVPESIPALSFPEAKKIANKISGKKTDMLDLEPEEERILVEYAEKELKSEFLFVTHYPTKKRPWYTMPDSEDPTYTKSFDLLFRGVEITTGGQRINHYGQLIESIKSRGINPENFRYYLMAFQYGMPPEGGLAIGLERLTAKLLGLANVKEATLFPRDMKRIDLLLHKEKIIKDEGNNGKQIFEKVKALLDGKKIKYETIEHKPAFTSEESAKARGTELKQGARALVLKADDKFIMAISSAAYEIDLEKLKSILGAREISLAKAEEVKKATGCEIGSVPPFGNLFDLPVYVDEKLLENEIIAFNAGTHTNSLKMKSKDLAGIVKPKIGKFAKAE